MRTSARGGGPGVLGRVVVRFLAILAILLAVAIVTTMSIDLGPALRARAPLAPAAITCAAT